MIWHDTNLLCKNKKTIAMWWLKAKGYRNLYKNWSGEIHIIVKWRIFSKTLTIYFQRIFVYSFFLECQSFVLLFIVFLFFAFLQSNKKWVNNFHVHLRLGMFDIISFIFICTFIIPIQCNRNSKCLNDFL